MEGLIYIRVDANAEIGTGHVMRCLSITDKITELGSRAVFITADYHSGQIIKERGYETICINSQWDDLNQEIEIMTALCCKNSIKKLLIDSYFVTKDYLENLGKLTDIIYIDDLDKFIYPVNLLINYNFYAEDMGYVDKYKNTSTKLLLGTCYVPLRKEFENMYVREFKGVNKILITSGGTDKYNMVGNILERLFKNCGCQDMEMYCILGRFNSNTGKLAEMYGNLPNVHLLNNVCNMAFYMGVCDLCITAGGTTIYELCVCGIPSIIYSIADNQINLSKKVDLMGLFSWAGDVRNGIDACLDRIEEMVALYKDSRIWNKTSKRMQELVDGQGALRIAREILR